MQYINQRENVSWLLRFNLKATLWKTNTLSTEVKVEVCECVVCFIFSSTCLGSVHVCSFISILKKLFVVCLKARRLITALKVSLSSCSLLPWHRLHRPGGCRSPLGARCRTGKRLSFSKLQWLAHDVGCSTFRWGKQRWSNLNSVLFKNTILVFFFLSFAPPKHVMGLSCCLSVTCSSALTVVAAADMSGNWKWVIGAADILARLYGN